MKIGFIFITNLLVLGIKNTLIKIENKTCIQQYRKDRKIMENKLRVWWIPQVGATSEAFYVPVQSVEEAKKVLDMLAAYDSFQLQNRIKPDYNNVGGLQVYNPEIADYEDWYLETDDDYFEDVDDYCEQCEKAEELTEFNQYLFEQIDWEKIERMTR